MSDGYILALDQGTTGTTVSLMNKSSQLTAVVNIEHPQIYPQAGWVEHEPEAIWRTVLDGIARVVEKAHVRPEEIKAIGITNQRETIVVWDARTGKAIYNAIVWQCRRTTEFCNRLKKSKSAKTIQKKTGLVVDPYFSASKMAWVLDHVPGARARAKRGELRVGTIDSFLLWRMTAGEIHKTDVSNASRTQLMNITTGQWDAELSKIFSVPLEILPSIHASNELFGKTKGVSGVLDGTPIHGVAGDQQAALFGQTCFEVGTAKCTFGTGSFLLMNTGSKMVRSKAGLLTTVAWKLKGDKKLTYALEGGAFICGAAVQWLRDQMRMIDKASDVEALARQVESTDGVYLVPAFVGLGAPYWDPDARAAVLGMTRGTNRSHFARAVLEAMAFQNVDILLAMEKDLGKKLRSVRVDGGAVHNNLLMQMQSDFLGVKVERPRSVESTVMGAGYLAGLGVGFWSGLPEIKKVWRVEREFSPELPKKKRLSRLTEWRNAVSRVRSATYYS
jgi:glycerol kinase